MRSNILGSYSKSEEKERKRRKGRDNKKGKICKMYVWEEKRNRKLKYILLRFMEAISGVEKDFKFVDC